MERRILATLPDTAHGLRKWRSLKLILPLRLSELRPWATAIASIAMIAAVVVSWTAFRDHQIGHSTATSNHLLPTVAPLREPHIPTATVPSLPTERVALQSRKAKPRRLALTSATESLALRELHAPSRPAPQMPLTGQEQLLQRFVQTRSPQELAALNPSRWTAQDAAVKAKFDKFFDNSPTGDDE
jgi:hypothetical protein